MLALAQLGDGRVRRGDPPRDRAAHGARRGDRRRLRHAGAARGQGAGPPPDVGAAAGPGRPRAQVLPAHRPPASARSPDATTMLAQMMHGWRPRRIAMTKRGPSRGSRAGCSRRRAARRSRRRSSPISKRKRRRAPNGAGMHDGAPLEHRQAIRSLVPPLLSARAADRAALTEDIDARSGEDSAPNVRLAMRRLRQSPGFTAICVVTLALGIGANTAVFTLIDRVMLSRCRCRARRSSIVSATNRRLLRQQGLPGIVFALLLRSLSASARRDAGVHRASPRSRRTCDRSARHGRGARPRWRRWRARSSPATTSRCSSSRRRPAASCSSRRRSPGRARGRRDELPRVDDEIQPAHGHIGRR